MDTSFNAIKLSQRNYGQSIDLFIVWLQMKSRLSQVQISELFQLQGDIGLNQVQMSIFFTCHGTA